MATDGTSVISDQKRRTLEALDRRFAVAKAELLQQQQDKNKRPREDEEEEGHEIRCSIVTPLACETSVSKAVAPSSEPSLHKVHFSFLGHTPSRGTAGVSDAEANGPAYSQLSQPVHENLLSSNIKISSKRGSQVDRIMHELLQNGDSAQKYMQGSRSMKIDNWILLDNLVQGSVSVGARISALQNCSKRSKKHMSIRKHKQCGTFDLPQEFHNFDTFKPMHDIWKDYIIQLLKNSGANQLAQCLLTADLHGAILLVAECKITTFNGVSGIMIRETAETFGIITRDNRFRVVPKRASVFIFQADCWKITLHGDKFASRDLSL